MEYYNPALFARQFGLTQLIPIPPYPSLNRNISDRDIVGDMKWVLRVREKSDDLKNQFCFRPFQELPYSTTVFHVWWSKKISSLQVDPLPAILDRILSIPDPVDSATQAELPTTSTTDTAVSQPVGKKRKALEKGKSDVQQIREFERFYKVKFHPSRPEFMRQVVLDLVGIYALKPINIKLLWTSF